MPTAKAAAVAIMAMLAFGVVVGGLISASTSKTLLVQSVPPTQPATSKTAPAAAAIIPSVSAPLVQLPAQVSQAAPTPSGGKTPKLPSTPLPPVKHVFMIVLSSQGFNQAFAPSSPAPYLATTLTSQGELLTNYYAVTQGELANEIALTSGQGPTKATAANCPSYTDVAPGTVGAMGQVQGDGCVYPASTATLPDQLTAAGKSWKAYIEDIGNGAASGQAATCRHPALGQSDNAHDPQPGDAYVTWRDPLVYFHSLVDNPACGTNDVGLDQLTPDLQLGSSAPSLSYIVPNRCHDGSDDPCAPGQPSGLPAADSFLHTVVPEIMASPAYQDGGLIAITFDQAPQTGPNADQSSCCNRAVFPNLPATATTPPPTGQVSPTGGGGRVGMLLLSPFVQPGTANQTNYYNHFSLLASVEDLFHLPRAGYAVVAAAVPSTTVTAAFAANASAGSLTGAGSTLVNPLMTQWRADFQAKTGNTVTYGSVGSGSGITQITNRTVDFGASDAPLTPSQAAACNGCVQIPWALTGVAVAFNVPGVTHLRLTPQIVASIYLGQITNWSDKRIKALNPGAHLPSLAITVAHRSDGSGTTYAFTDLLSHASRTWAHSVGFSVAVNWPTGVGGNGNPGVTAVVGSTTGAIGYIGADYAVAHGINVAALKNRAGKFVYPNLGNISAAAKGAKRIPKNNAIDIVWPTKDNKKGYPGSTFSWAIVPHNAPQKALDKQFILYALTDGQRFGPALDFPSVPKAIVAKGEEVTRKPLRPARDEVISKTSRVDWPGTFCVCGLVRRPTPARPGRPTFRGRGYPTAWMATGATAAAPALKRLAADGRGGCTSSSSGAPALRAKSGARRSQGTLPRPGGRWRSRRSGSISGEPRSPRRAPRLSCR